MNKDDLEFKIRAAIGDILDEYDKYNYTYKVSVLITHYTKRGNFIIDTMFSDTTEFFNTDEED